MAEIAERYGQAVSANNHLTGRALAVAAKHLVNEAHALGAVLYPVDDHGARVVGAALLNEGVRAADPWARFDKETVFLVSGAIAGPVGVSESARRARSMGAVAVHAAIVDGFSEPISGCDSIITLVTDGRAPRRLNGHHSAA